MRDGREEAAGRPPGTPVGREETAADREATPADGKETAVEPLPDVARVLGVVLSAGGEGAEALLSLAEAEASRRRTLVVDLAGAAAGDPALSEAGSGGLAAVARGALELREAAVRPSGRRFLYLPGGCVGEEDGGLEASGPGEPALPAGVLRLVAGLGGKVRELEGLLLLAVTPAQAGPVLGALKLDGLVLEEGVDAPGEPVLPADLPVVARLGERRPPPEREAPGSGRETTGGPAPDGSGAGGSGTGPRGGGGRKRSGSDGGRESGTAGGSVWRRHRRRGRAPWLRIGAAAALILGLVAAWWVLVREVDGVGAEDAGSGPSARTARAAGADATTGAAVGSGAGVDAGAGATSGGSVGAGEGDPSVAPVEAAPELPFSVLVASYLTLEDARAGAERPGAGTATPTGGGPVWFTAPTPVRGRTYHRLYAGALADRVSAESLMRRLVREGAKESASGWDLRPVGLAYLLGVHPRRETAAARADSLRRAGLPAYLLAAAGEDTVWAIWAGGFEDREAAAGLGRLLREQGLESSLRRRRGVPSPASSSAGPAPPSAGTAPPSAGAPSPEPRPSRPGAAVR